ncbi:SRPBCC family protein [Sphingosinithalassobacter sp. LHW66-3]|uniref:SRPBCC family protein n=1 Tax=Sphingosinithalassobacter sp. LHW66-3 TaxID=3424718 RepID=UPI003D6ADFC5
MPIRILLPLALLAAAAPAAAEVVEVTDTGFVSRHRIAVAAPPEAVWNTLIQPALWWQGAHTYSGDAANLSLALAPGGCWCERWAGGGVEHMRVVQYLPGGALRLSGGLGPLQGAGVSAALTFTLEPDGQTTVLTATYVVGGFVPQGIAAFATPVDGVLASAFANLAATAERAVVAAE